MSKSKNKSKDVKESKNIPNIKDVDFSSNNLPNQVKLSADDLSEVLCSYTLGVNNQLRKLQNVNSSNFNPYISEEFVSSFETEIKGATPQQLTEWLKSPKTYASQLRSYGQYLLALNGQYKRTLDLYIKTLTFDYMWIPLCDFKEINKNKQTRDDFYKYRKKVFNTLKKLNIKYQYQKITQKLLEDGVAFYYKNVTKDFITLYPLPSDYCKIISEFDLGYRFALDLTCFDNIVGLKDSVPLLYKQYEVFCKIRDMNTLSQNELLSFQYVTIPVDMGYCFTFDEIHTDCTPPFKASFKDAIDIPQYKNILRTKLMLDTVQIIAQKIPQASNGELILETNQVADLVQMSARLLPTGVKTFATPFEPVAFNFSNSQQNQQLLGVGEELLNMSTGTNGSLIGAKTNSALSLSFSLEGMFGFVEHLYRQFENFTILQISDRKYPSSIKFFGNRYTKKEDIKLEQSLVQSTNMPIGKLYALQGYEPFEVESLLDYEKFISLKDKGIPILSGNVMSGKDKDTAKNVDNKGGRTEKPISELGDSGESTRQHESNQKALKS